MLITDGPLVATAAGEIRVAALAEIDRLSKSANGDARRTIGYGLDRLLNAELITSADTDSLNQIVDSVLGVQNGKLEYATASAGIEQAYFDLISRTNSSQVAIAIASLCASGTSRATGNAETPIAMAARSNVVDGAMVGGAIAGAAIGGAIGGPGGAVIGAVVGGISAGGAAALCAD